MGLIMKIYFCNEAPKELTKEAFEALPWQEIGSKKKATKKSKKKKAISKP